VQCLRGPTNHPPVVSSFLVFHARAAVSFGVRAAQRASVSFSTTGIFSPPRSLHGNLAGGSVVRDFFERSEAHLSWPSYANDPSPNTAATPYFSLFRRLACFLRKMTFLCLYTCSTNQRRFGTNYWRPYFSPFNSF